MKNSLVLIISTSNVEKGFCYMEEIDQWSECILLRWCIVEWWWVLALEWCSVTVLIILSCPSSS